MHGFFGADSADSASGVRVNVVSFGYKYGLPADADIVADCRFLPNPHWIQELAPLTGQDPPVRDYVLGQPGRQGVHRCLRRGDAGGPGRLRA